MSSTDKTESVHPSEIRSLAGDGNLKMARERTRLMSPEDQASVEPLLACLEVTETKFLQEKSETALSLLDVAVDLGLAPVDRARWAGRIYENARDGSPAMEILEEAMRMSPMHPEVPYRLVRLLISAARHQEAWEVLGNLPPEVAARPLLDLAECRLLQAEGRFEEIVTKLTELGPRRMPILENERLSLLTTALDRTNRGREAVIEASRRRAMESSSFDEERFLDLVARRLAEPMPAEPAPVTSGAPKMLFIMAAFRSGTTLVERMIADHPDAHGIGESEIVRSVIWRKAVDGIEPEADFAPILNTLREHHGQAQLFVAKNVDLWYMLPRLIGRFPNPRFLVLTRDPIEIGLSMWKSSLSAEQFPFLARIDWIGWYLGICRAALEHWISIPGLPLSSIDYADLIREPEAAESLVWKAAGLEPPTEAGTSTPASPSLTGPRTISSNFAAAPVKTVDRGNRAEEFGEDLTTFQEAYERGRSRLHAIFPPAV